MTKRPVLTIILLCLAACMMAGLQTAQAELVDGLIAYWPLDEGEGTTAADAYTGTHNGTVENGATWVAGKVGSALEFYGGEGGGDVSIPMHAELMPPEVFSVQAWANWNSHDINWAGIVSNFYDTGSNEGGWLLFGWSYDSVWFALETGNTQYTEINGGAMGTGVWHHLVGVYDGSFMRLYVDGSEAAYSPKTGSIDYQPEALEFSIGRFHDNDEDFSFDGKVDEVALWGRALTVDEVTWLYNGGAGNPIPLMWAIYPTPSNGAELVPVDQVLSWTEPGAGTQTGYDVYFGTDPNVGDNPKVIDDKLLNEYDPPGLLANDTTYYWRVDVYEEGTILHEGSAWSFTTVPGVPYILEQPEDTTVPAGTTAVFTISGLNVETYQWYKDGDLLSDVVDKISGTNTDTLTISNVQVEDEGFYYCILSNGLGPVESEHARLWTERLIGYWPMDGDATDAEGDIDGTVVGAATWVEGISGLAVNLVQSGTDPNFRDYVILGGADELSPRTNTDFTVSVWVNTTGWEDDAAIISNKDWYSGYTSGWAIAGQSGGAGSWQWNFSDGLGGRADYDPSGPIVSDGLWHHLCVTHERDGAAKFYFDGVTQDEVDISGISGSLDTGYPTVIGTGGAEGEFWPYWFIGAIDEVRFYSYALDPYTVAGLYTDLRPGESVCVEIDEFDLNEDCIVNVGDFVAFAESWLVCNIVPDCIP